MKKVAIFMLLLTLSFCSETTKEDINTARTFIETFGGSERDFGKSVVQTNDGGFVVTGYKGDYDLSSWDLWLIKTDVYGNEEWNRTFGGDIFDSGEDIAQTKDGGLIVTGWTESSGAGGYDLWLLKTDSTGNEEWSKTFGGEGEDRGFAVEQTNDKGFIIAGFASLAQNGETNAWLIKTDSTGTEEWSRTFHFQYFDCAYDVTQTNDGGYAMTGSATYLSNTSAWLLKTDENGLEQWRHDNYNEMTASYSLAQTADAGFVITGYKGSFSDSADAMVVRTDDYGFYDWSIIYDDMGNERGNSIVVTSENEYMITGYTETTSGDMSDLFLLKCTEAGNISWSKNFDLSLKDFGYKIIETADSGYVVTGMTETDEEGDVLLIKTDEYGNAD
ncbi:MAG: hypothetical protein KGY74_06350 [Candidatus Cloacimonetes bacterium]|nr:hypothetical protein [Candidatus Cloacimonadota bacterium]